MPNKTKQKGGQQNERVSALQRQVENLEKIILSGQTRENLENPNPNPNKTPNLPGMSKSPPLSNLERQLRKLKNTQNKISFGKRVSQAPVPKPSRQSNTRTNLNKARENALRPNSNNTKYSSKKTRCNNKGVPWYRKTIPQSRDITFEVEQVSEKKSVNVKTGVSSETVLVRVTWKSDVVNEKKDVTRKKEIIGYYTPIGKDSFKVTKKNEVELNKLGFHYRKTPAPGICYEFKVGNTDMAKIRGKIIEKKKINQLRY